MVHQLTVSASLNGKEVFARTSFKLALSIRNSGAITFPGGKITKVQLEFPHSKTFLLQPEELPKLSSGEIYEKSFDFFAAEEGICWVFIEIESNDGVDIDLFSGERNMSKSWHHNLYFFRYEDSKIIEILNSINDGLNKIISKMEAK